MNSMNKLDVTKLLMEAKRIKEDFLTTINNLLDSVSIDYSQKKEEIIKKYDLKLSDKFNIFETISDLYKREKFHSDILYTILNPHTPQIGQVANLTFIENFIKILDLDYKFIVDNTIEISKEKVASVWIKNEEKRGYIDLLITNNHNQAIIIENKLNYAPDMPNQIVRYMKYIQEEKFGKNNEVDMTVVYLTLIPGKIPNIDSYDASFADYQKLIIDAKKGIDGKILKYRCAVDSNKEKKSLVDFLDDCLLSIESKDITNSNVMLTKVYLEQYRILLEHLGGNVAMLEYQKELLKNIYSSETYCKAANDLVEVFNDNNIVNAFITDQLKDFLQPLGFCFNGWGYIVKNAITSDYLYVAGFNKSLQIGFGNENEGIISKPNQKKYQNILEKIYKNIEVQIEGDTWVYIDIEPLQNQKNLNSFLEFYTGLLTKVKQSFLEVK